MTEPPIGDLLASDANFKLAFNDDGHQHSESQLRYAAHMTSVSREAGPMMIQSNYEQASSGAPFAPADWLCKGFSKALTGDMPIGNLVVESDESGELAILTNGNWFGKIYVAGPVHIPYTDEEAHERIVQAAKELSASPEKNAELMEFAEACLKRLGSGGSGRLSEDPASWPDVVEGHGHFLGLYKNDAGERFLAVHTSAGVLGQCLNGLALERADDHTVRSFYNSEAYRFVEEFAERRAKRLLNRLALLLGAARSAPLVIDVDLKAYRDKHDPHAVGPSRVDGNYAASTYNMLHPVGGDQQQLVYYSNTTRLGGGAKRAIYLLGPKDGLRVVDLDPAHNYTTFEHHTHDMLLGKHGAVHHVPNPHAALPVSPGRHHSHRHDGDDDGLSQLAFHRGDSVPPRLLSYRGMSERLERIYGGLIHGARTHHLRPVAFIFADD